MRIKILSLLIVLLVLTSCNMPDSNTGANSDEFYMHLLLDGTHLDVGQPLEVKSTFYLSTSVSSVAVVVNDVVYRQDYADPPRTSSQFFQNWIPTEAGTYTIKVRLSTADGELDSNEETVTVGEPDTATLPPPTDAAPTQALLPGVTPSATSILPSATSPPAATNVPTSTTIPPTAVPPTAVPPTATIVIANSTISGKVFRDENGSGSLNPADTPISSVTMLLGNGACPSSGLQSTQTSGDGSYAFSSLPAGQYCVTADPNSLPDIGGSWQASTGNPHTLTLGNSDGQTRNFMFRPIIN